MLCLAQVLVLRFGWHARPSRGLWLHTCCHILSAVLLLLCWLLLCFITNITLVLCPPGWTYRRSGKLETRKEGVATVYGIPYSEHSNYAELRDCVASLRPKQLIPTVNVTEDPAR